MSWSIYNIVIITAVKYYTQAVKAADGLDERLKLPLILARNKASCKDVELVAAHEDIKLAKEIAPEDISVIEKDANTLLAQNEFERALVQYSIGHDKRIKPDTCDTGIKVVSITVCRTGPFYLLL